MVLLKTLWFAFYTLLVVRVFAARATVSERTIGTYLLFGGLYGLVAQPLLERVVSPYGEMGPWVAFFGALSLHAALLAPVVWHLFRSRAVRGLSVADALVVAFAIGFGATLASALLRATVAEEVLPGLTNFPPWQTLASPEGEGPVAAGVGYWTAFTALLMAGAARFAKWPWAVWAAGAAGLLFTSFEAGALRVPPTGIWETLFKLTRQGGLTAWAVLIGVVVLQVMEGRWERAARSEADGNEDLLEEGRTLIAALFARRFGEFAERARAYRLARQGRISLATAQASAHPERAARGARAMIARAFGGAVPPPDYGSPQPPPRFVAAWGGAIAFAVAVFVVPRLPEGLRNWLWSFWGLHFALPGLPFTILTAVLTVIVVRRLLAAPGRPASPGRPDDLLGFLAERAVGLASFGLLLGALLYAQPGRLIDPTPYLQNVEAGVQPWHAATLLLLAAAAATGVLARRTSQWQAAPIEDRRRAALRTALESATLFLLVWAVDGFYTAELAKFHDKLGPALYRRFEGDGNYVAAILTATVVGLASAAVMVLARRWIGRTEAFLVGSRDA